MLQLVRRWWWVLVLCPVIGTSTALAVSMWMTPIYHANLILLIGESEVPGSGSYNEILAAERRTNTYSHLVKDQPVLTETIRRLGLATSPEDLRDEVAVSVIPDTQLVQVTVSNPSPKQAAAIANTLGDVFIEYLQTQQEAETSASRTELERSIAAAKERIDDTTARIEALESSSDAPSPAVRSELGLLHMQLARDQNAYTSLLETQQRMELAEAKSRTAISVATAAYPPTDSISPRPVRNALLGGALSLIIAIGLVLIFGYLDDTVKTADDVSRLTGRTCLGSIPAMRNADRQIETLVQPRSVAAEAYRALRTNLEFAAVDHDLRSILVTSTRPTDGKTQTIANLAVVLAQGGQRVLLVDGDLRKPRIHQLFPNLSNRFGLTNLLIRNPQVELESLTQQTDVPGLQVLTSGPLPPNPADVLNSDRIRAILPQLEQACDLLLIDSSPLALTDPLLLGRLVDGVILVVHSRRTRTRELERGIEDVARAGTPLLGVVINQADLSEDLYYGYDAYRGYYGPDPSGEARVESDDDSQGRASTRMPSAEETESPREHELRPLTPLSRHR